MKIELCPTTEIDKFLAGQERFYRLIGIHSALMTDRSQVGDFDVQREGYRALTTAVGYIVGRETLVWKVCRDLQR